MWGSLSLTFITSSSQERRSTSICSAQARWHTAGDQEIQFWSSLFHQDQRSRSGEKGVTRSASGDRNWPWWWFEKRREEAPSFMPQSSLGHSLCARPCSDLLAEPHQQAEPKLGEQEDSPYPTGSPSVDSEQEQQQHPLETC